jgi:hypothetical protein
MPPPPEYEFPCSIHNRERSFPEVLTRSIRVPCRIHPRTLQRHNSENLKQTFPGKKLRGYSPNSYILVSASDLHIPLIYLYIPLCLLKKFKYKYKI